MGVDVEFHQNFTQTLSPFPSATDPTQSLRHAENIVLPRLEVGHAATEKQVQIQAKINTLFWLKMKANFVVLFAFTLKMTQFGEL